MNINCIEIKQLLPRYRRLSNTHLYKIIENMPDDGNYWFTELEYLGAKLYVDKTSLTFVNPDKIGFTDTCITPTIAIKRMLNLISLYNIRFGKLLYDINDNLVAYKCVEYKVNHKLKFYANPDVIQSVLREKDNYCKMIVTHVDLYHVAMKRKYYNVLWLRIKDNDRYTGNMSDGEYEFKRNARHLLCSFPNLQIVESNYTLQDCDLSPYRYWRNVDECSDANVDPEILMQQLCFGYGSKNAKKLNN